MYSAIYPKVKHLNSLLSEVREYKEKHPEARVGYYLSIPSLLNAYREGDISFDECVAELEKLKKPFRPMRVRGRQLRSQQNLNSGDDEARSQGEE